MPNQPVLLVAADLVKTGGMDRANFALGQYLAERGDELHLVGHSASSDLLGHANVTFHRAFRPAKSNLLGGPVLDHTGRYWAEQLQARGGRAIVNGGNCRWGDVNWVHYVHAAYQPEIAGGSLRRWRWRLAHQTYLRDERLALRRARVVIVNSHRTRRDVIEHIGVPPDRVRCVYLGIDADLFAPGSAGECAAAKRKLGWNDAPVVAFIGGLSDRRKGFDTVYAAWKALTGSPSWEANLAVMGAGAEMPEWKARAEADGMSNRIRFLGFRRDVPAVLAACDAFVAPARYESYGMAVLEALCMAIPALVSKHAGVAERYPAELETLLIDDPGDAHELEERLRNWYANQAKLTAALQVLSPRLRAHTWNRMAEEFMQVVKDSN